MYKGCTWGVQGVLTGCTMEKTVGIPGASGVHPLYTVLRADEYGLAVHQIEGLWNPHGGKFTPKGAPGLDNGYPEKDGVFQMPMRDFVQQFSGRAFEAAELPATRLLAEQVAPVVTRVVRATGNGRRSLC